MWVVPGQDGRAVALGEVDERPLEVEQGDVELVDRPARPEPQVGGDLVVARAAGVEPPGERPDLLGQRRLDVHVDVLERPVPREPARGDVLGQRLQAVDQRLDVVGASGCPARPRPRTWAIEPAMSSRGEGGVDLDRAREVRHARVRLAAEPPAPGPHRPSV